MNTSRSFVAGWVCLIGGGVFAYVTAKRRVNKRREAIIADENKRWEEFKQTSKES